MMISTNVPKMVRSDYSTIMMAQSSKSNFGMGSENQSWKTSGPITASFGSRFFSKFRKDPVPTKMVSTSSAFANDFTGTH